VKRSGDLGVYVLRWNGDLPIWGLLDSARLLSAVCVLGLAMRRGELEKAEGNKGIGID
jgi:hypothetical protein